MSSITPEQFADELRTALPGSLRSVMLFGSAVSGDFVDAISGFDILTVADRFDATSLRAICEPVKRWIVGGNPPPQLFTPEELAVSADAFAIEWLDMQQSRRLLFGADLLDGLHVKDDLLRLQVERELKGKLLALRQRYVANQQRPKKVAALMTDSLVTFLVLFRAALRLYEKIVPARKLDALARLSEHVAFDVQPFLRIHALKQRQVRLRDFAVDETFAAYLQNIDAVVAEVDRHIHHRT